MLNLSFIVPVYNSATYIERCIRSLYTQDLDWSLYEVICVDDCSKDNSPAIIKRLQKEFPSLRLFTHERNKKQGGARNTGLIMAQGSYVWFVDSDDYIQNYIIGKLVQIAEHNELDILHFDYINVIGQNMVPCNCERYDAPLIHSGIDFFVFEKYGKWWQRCIEPWHRIMRKDFLVENGLWFKENVSYEDTDWSIRCYLKAQRVMHVDEAPYFYRLNADSTTHAKISSKMVFDKLSLLIRCAHICSELTPSRCADLIEEFIHNEASMVRSSVAKISGLKDMIRYRRLVVFCRFGSLNKYISLKTRLMLKGFVWI